MGWNKRTTRKLFDSLSEHAFMIGCQTGMIIGLMATNKKCSVCRSVNKWNTEAPEHDYVVNWIGSSGVMEAGAALQKSLNSQRTQIGVYISNTWYLMMIVPSDPTSVVLTMVGSWKQMYLSLDFLPIPVTRSKQCAVIYIRW